MKGILTLIGHSSVKIITDQKTVIYIDPYFPGDYTEPADIILITHGHSDHNQLHLVTTTENTIVIDYKLALLNQTYQSFQIKDVKIDTVMAYNKNHSIKESVGYIISYNNISIYHAGDTSMTTGMEQIQTRNLTYALYPCDGVWNMDAKEATEAAEMVKAKFSIPMHTNAALNHIDESIIANFTPQGRLIIPYGTSIELTD